MYVYRQAPVTTDSLCFRVSWVVEWLVSDTTWRPELEVCASDHASHRLVIAPNTLWYGTYRLRATASVYLTENNRNSSRIRHDVSAVGAAATLIETSSRFTYLQVTSSPLVAAIQGQDATRYVTRWDVININMTSSFDPDVTMGNQTGMQFHLFCYTKSSAQQVRDLSLENLLDVSTKLTNNSKQTAHLYELNTGPCFNSLTNIWLVGTELVFDGNAATTNDSLLFHLFVTKDDRRASSVAEVTVRATNITVDNALDAIDALLASGDTSAALLVIDLAASALDVDDTVRSSAMDVNDTVSSTCNPVTTSIL